MNETWEAYIALTDDMSLGQSIVWGDTIDMALDMRVLPRLPKGAAWVAACDTAARELDALANTDACFVRALRGVGIPLAAVSGWLFPTITQADEDLVDLLN